MPRPVATKRRGLTRQAIVERAIAIGNAKGLDAVSIRRLAADFGVTPMALYRHVKDKQDLVNAMTEVVLDGMDLKVGFRPSMTWSDRARQAMTNFKDQMDARPLALPLAIAYTGEGFPGFWRMTEDLLGILLEAGFARREATILIRVLSNLLSGYLLLLRQDDPAVMAKLNPRERDLLVRRFELSLMSLPRDDFPDMVEGAHDMADVWLSNPNRWWRDTTDLVVFGLEAMLERRRGRTRLRSRHAS